MLSVVSGEQKLQDDSQAYRCRIPQRLPPGPHKKPIEKNKSLQYCSESVYTRPKSAGRAKYDSSQANHERLLPAQKKPAGVSATQRKSTYNENILVSGNKTTKQIITVPLANKQKCMGTMRTTFRRNFATLPDQETIKRHEDLETQQNDQSESPPILYSEGDPNEKDSVTSRRDKVLRLKKNWQEQTVKFENMKTDLIERQRTILELYASLRGTHRKLSTLGHTTNLPPADDLRVMNVANMTPEQLLRLCSESKQHRDDKQVTHNPLKLDQLDIRKMNQEIPMKLVNLCEETLIKRKEIIDWFETLKNQEKGCSISNLTKKIKEFNAENEMLYSTLEKVKSEFTKEINEIFDYLRKSVNEIVTLQVRTEELTCTLSDIHSKNNDLRKQMYNADQCRSQNNKSRIEELEKQLKDEKLMKVTIKDRLSRAEGQVKMGENNVRQLEATLNQAHTRIRDLERTVQHLTDQNQRLQLEFDNELNKLNQLIKENTIHLEEIADAREKLQTEKEDLEKRLEELSNHYNESLDNIKEEQSINIAKIIELEKKYNEEIEERKKRDTKIESLCAQLVETELRYKDTSKLLEEQTLLHSKSCDLENEILTLKSKLNKNAAEIEEHKQSLKKKNNIIIDLEQKISDSFALKEKLKCELNEKDKYICELKAKLEYMEEQLHKRDIKMKQYEEHLCSLKNQLAELQERWGDIESLNYLRDVVNDQNAKLHDITRQNNNLAEELEKKNIELKQQGTAMKEQEDVVKQIQSREEEQVNIIKLLRNNLEMRTQVDAEMNRQLVEKNAEIALLLNNLKRLKQQINQLEKIILTLESQIQKNVLQKNKDDKKIQILEEKLAKYNACRLECNKEMENPANNLDHLIKIIEDELSSPIDSYVNNKNENFDRNKKNTYKSNGQQLNQIFFQENMTTDHYKGHDTVPTKIEMGNFVKKTYVPNTNDLTEIGDYDKNIFGRNMRKSISYRDTESVHTPPEILINSNDMFTHLNPTSASYSEDRNVTRNLDYFIPDRMKDEKKRKMFKLVGHRL